MCNSLCKIHASLRTRFFILRFDPLPEIVLNSRLKTIATIPTEPPGRFDIRLRRSDLRYFLLNPQDSQKATKWLTKLMCLHPFQRKQFWKQTYNEMSLQTFGCHLLSLSLITNTGFDKRKGLIKICDPNLSTWITQESAIEYMEKMWLEFLVSIKIDSMA